MSHGKTALSLMMVLALPSAAQALGLGEIHLDSALNEPLAADIDIVGATAEDLAGITASIANRETFAHFGVDRPAYLSTVAFKISRDRTGRVVLAIRTTDACTDPVLDMLVDVRWGGGELIRHYTLLLDPPGFHSATPVAEAFVGAAASYTVPVSVLPAVSTAPIQNPNAPVEAAPAAAKASTRAGEPAARKTVRVGAKATLRGVAWRVGARSDADLNRMMIAIFRANPNAFEGNINRLRRGALLTIPFTTEILAISVANANREVRAQMQAWRASTPGRSLTKSVAPAVAAAASSIRESAVPAGSAASAETAPAAVASAARSAEPAAAADMTRDPNIQQPGSGLEKSPDPFDHEHEASLGAQAQLTPAENAPAADAPVQSNSGGGLGSKIAAILALAAAAFGSYAWRRRRALQSPLSPVEPKLRDLAHVQAAAQVAVRVSLAPRTPVPMQPHDVPHPTHAVRNALAVNAETGERQWVADALGRRGNSPEIESGKAANPNDAINLETLELSYLLQESGGGLDDTVEYRDRDKTAKLPVPPTLGADDPTVEMTPVATACGGVIPAATTQTLGVRDNATTATRLEFDLLDPEVTVQHVQMPSALHENVGFKERRTSLVEALKSAMEREPHRRDLRMKLLETYFAAAATNRQGFLDMVQKIANERASLNEGEWDKIAWMGRQIASDDDLFAPSAAQPDEEDLANCA